MARLRILVIDDEGIMREYVEEALKRGGHDVDTASNGKDGVELFTRNSYDVVVTDLKMTPMDGLEVLRRLRHASARTHCIIMTAYGAVDTAVTALKEGAADYIMKPFSPDELEMAISRAVEKERLSEENRYLRDEVNARFDSGSMVGTSPAMKEVYEQVRKVASSRSTILIRGASGTGKELVARAVHYSGNRADKPFIKVNCAALSAGLLESELFGHEKGAFTGAHDRKLGRFELADGGTLLLDEVSEMNAELQPKLLRVLQEREFERVGGNKPIQVDTRIICTSNRNLEQAVRENKFREDLFFRLNVIPILLPPLSDRRQDISALMDHFLARFSRENGRSINGFTPAARKLFQDYGWPGNVRELQNMVERAVVLSASDILDVEDFTLSGLSTTQPGKAAFQIPVGYTIAGIEKELILRTLEACNQNRTEAARRLDISVRTLRNKLKEYGQAAGLGEGDGDAE